ncbi:MAG: DUF4215 domain-containing protein [Myxococcales bacterium]|nr:DUF4215 domain-containing protein [Myxococcales bacterium]
MRSRPLLPPLLLTLPLALLLPGPARAAADCKPDSPATPVPQYTDEAPGVSLWPLGVHGEIRLRPAGVAPGTTRAQLSPLPENRDSTQYLTQTAPGLQSGHELFKDVAVADARDEGAGQSRWLVAVYNAGIQIWDLNDPEKPNVTQIKDGWEPPYGPGHWAAFPAFGEQDSYVWSVDAVSRDGLIVIGAGARLGAGFSAWAFDPAQKLLTQLYQDTTADARDVELVTAPGGRVYAFTSDPAGARVYDLSAALESGLCVDEPGDAVCGVLRGYVGQLPQSQFVATLVVDETIYVAGAAGNMLNPSLGLELWGLEDPDDPGAATRRFASPGDARIHGPQLFTYAGRHYLALVDKSAGISEPGEMRVHELAGCLDEDGCAELPPPLAVEPLLLSLANYHYLDVSFSAGAPYLHYGMETTGLFGAGFERLWSLERLPQPFAPDTLPELTDGGGAYPDPCDDELVDYFGDYYVNNDYGLRHFNPRHAVFTGAYLYRAAESVLDGHVRDIPECGDGLAAGDEECDDGNDVDADACTNACTLPRCGDGIVQGGEACDDGDDDPDDGCSNECATPICGDGVVQGDEECDDPDDPDCVDCSHALATGTDGGGSGSASGGATSDAGSSSAGTSAGADDSDATGTDSGAPQGDGDDGCGCATAGADDRGPALAWLGLLALLGRARRRGAPARAR